MKTVGVIGSGTMGNGIAQSAAQAGFTVILQDIDNRSLDRGITAIEKSLQRLLKKQQVNQQAIEETLSRIHTTTDIHELAEVDILFEAIIEKMEPKKALFKQLDNICSPSTLFASNTSGISITELASSTSRPDKFIGMHFFNPVPVMNIVEIVKGYKTSESTLETILAVADQLGKQVIIAKDTPLFIVNRILIPMINEAIFLLAEGTVSVDDIDNGMKLACGHPIGPLALADLIGLDTLLLVIETLFEETGDPKYRPCPYLKTLVRAGQLGRKTGRGFLEYND
jgi:3-hydroxybutyryl-CoA dehydrogenase